MGKPGKKPVKTMAQIMAERDRQARENIQKRAERISQAVYLASNHIKDNEPLKWEIRRESLSFLSH